MNLWGVGGRRQPVLGAGGAVGRERKEAALRLKYKKILPLLETASRYAITCEERLEVYSMATLPIPDL